MTTLVNSHPYTRFLLGQVLPASEAAIRAEDASAATVAGLVVTIDNIATTCVDYVEAIGTFNDTEGGDSQTVTNLASRAGQNAPSPVPTWEAPCTMRVYLGNDGSHALIREHGGYWVLYAEHAQLGKMVAVVVFTAMSRPFVESGELIVSFTLQNAGRFLPKWVA